MRRVLCVRMYVRLHEHVAVTYTKNKLKKGLPTYRVRFRKIGKIK